MRTEDHAGQKPAAGFTIECKVHFRSVRGSRKQAQEGAPPEPPQAGPGSVPRIARLMALAIRFDGLVRCGEVRDFADLARLGFVTRARMTQIMNLLLLAPDIQESILHLPLTTGGRDWIIERDVRPVICVLDWGKQRRMWEEVKAASGAPVLSPSQPAKISGNAT